MDVKTMRSALIAVRKARLHIDGTSDDVSEQQGAYTAELDRRDAELAQFAALKEALEVVGPISIHPGIVRTTVRIGNVLARPVVVAHDGTPDGIAAAIIEAAKAVRGGQ